MARGWESKNIEDQIRAAEAKQQDHLKPIVSPDELEHQKRLESLKLERSRIEREIHGAHNERYRDLLKSSLLFIENEIGKLEPNKPPITLNKESGAGEK